MSRMWAWVRAEAAISSCALGVRCRTSGPRLAELPVGEAGGQGQLGAGRLERAVALFPRKGLEAARAVRGQRGAGEEATQGMSAADRANRGGGTADEECSPADTGHLSPRHESDGGRGRDSGGARPME